MTKFQNFDDATTHIADSIVEAIKTGDVWAKTGYSNQSCSTYVEFASDVDSDETFCIRISDHEARSYNRNGDFEITFGDVHGDTNAAIRVSKRYERDEFIAIEFDEDGEPLEFDVTVTECDEDDDDAEFAGYVFNTDDIGAAIEAAVEFAKTKLQKAVA